MPTLAHLMTVRRVLAAKYISLPKHVPSCVLVTERRCEHCLLREPTTPLSIMLPNDARAAGYTLCRRHALPELAAAINRINEKLIN